MQSTGIPAGSNKTIIVICGPTAIGKTDLSIWLAKQFDTEILSSDSRQFYIETNAGTAKPSQDQLASVKHHFINSLSIENEYDVGRFERDALLCLEDLFKTRHVVIVSGGSGLYIKALTEGLDSFPEIPPDVIESLNQELLTEGLDKLKSELRTSDISYFSEMDQNNPQRIVRALSVIRHTGKPFSSFRTGNPKERNFRTIYVSLHMDRVQLYNRINQRVDSFVENGLLEEAKNLYPLRHLNALRTVGYTELFDHLDGKYSLEEAIEKIKQHTRNYAKRQETWIRKYIPGERFNPNDWEKILHYLLSRLK